MKLFLSVLLLQATSAFASTLIVLAKEAPNAASWALSPLPQELPAEIRQNILLLREDLVDEGKTQPKTSLDAYRAGYQVCNSLIAALDERDAAKARAGMSQTQVIASGTARNEARRNYMMSWPQYQADAAREERANENLQDAKDTLSARQNATWLKRAAELRASLENTYATYRDALRKDPAFVQAIATASTITAPAISGTSPQGAPASQKPLPRAKYTNALGMIFVPVEGTNVLFCIHETRRQDFQVYADESSTAGDHWRDVMEAGVPVGQEGSHPVVNINYDDAKGFCDWLSKKEGRFYRLPTDHEWSCAVGIGEAEDPQELPERLSQKIQGKYSWGSQFPPPRSVGNLADDSAKKLFPALSVIQSYSDGFATTSPVMSFKPNRLGIHDLAGNVWEWVESWYDAAQEDRLMRGCSWRLSDEPRLLASNRSRAEPSNRKPDHGFRCVIDLAQGAASQAPRNMKAKPVSASSLKALKAGEVLGVALAADSQVPFIWCPPGEFLMGSPKSESGRKDGVEDQVSVKLSKGFWISSYEWQQKDWQAIEGSNPSETKGETMPVTNVGWNDAIEHCAKLNALGILPSGYKFTLPTEAQWEYACRAGTNSALYNGKNLSGLTSCTNLDPIAWYRLNSAEKLHPVGGKKPNKWGAFDMLGNVWEWCLDSYADKLPGGSDPVNLEDGQGKVTRGGAWWAHSLRSRSADRGSSDADYRFKAVGFRVCIIQE
jgi:formylglycine-generating enzyme required for sulfatase activity